MTKQLVFDGLCSVNAKFILKVQELSLPSTFLMKAAGFINLGSGG